VVAQTSDDTTPPLIPHITSDQPSWIRRSRHRLGRLCPCQATCATGQKHSVFITSAWCPKSTLTRQRYVAKADELLNPEVEMPEVDGYRKKGTPNRDWENCLNSSSSKASSVSTKGTLRPC